jgi:DNA repair protein RadA/Sms
MSLVETYSELREEAKKAKPPEAPIHLDEIDAFELQQLQGEELKSIPLLQREGYLIEGWSHLLSGYPRCGKTELLFACACEWLKQGRTILYFTEEARQLWQQRLEQRPVPTKGLQLVWALGEMPGNLRIRMNEGSEQIVILDTIRNLSVMGADENDNAAVAAALSPWVKDARLRNKTLILCHHSRKGGGDHGEAISGGHALFGAVDVALEVRRDNVPSRRTIKAHARLIQPPDLLYERREDGTLLALGDPAGVGVEEVAKRVVDVLDGQWATTKEVRSRLIEPIPGLEQVRLALTAEARCGRVEREPPIDIPNVAGKTVRWRLPGEG